MKAGEHCSLQVLFENLNLALVRGVLMGETVEGLIEKYGRWSGVRGSTDSAQGDSMGMRHGRSLCNHIYGLEGLSLSLIG